MRIFRYLDQAGKMGFGRFDEQGQTFLIVKEEDGSFQATDQKITPFQLLTPIDFRCIYAIGLNYRAHAEETGSELPKHPMVFMKLYCRSKSRRPYRTSRFLEVIKLILRRVGGCNRKTLQKCQPQGSTFLRSGIYLRQWR